MSSAVRRRVRNQVPEATPAVAEAAPRAAVVPSPYFRWKDLPGRCLAFAMFVAGLPIMAATIVVVRLTSPGPAIFRQTRVGRHGRTYTMYKIRTMRVDAEAATGPVWTQLRDPRITPVGRCVRKLHLDEFPQLINVLRGEMALIGPRPERPEFTQKLALALPGYLDRLSVRPGITGLAQINLPPDTDLESVHRKLVLDLLYVREGGLLLDLRILACTFVRLFGIKGRRVTRLFGIEQLPHLSKADVAADHERNVLALGVGTSANGQTVTSAQSAAPTAALGIYRANGHAANGHDSNGRLAMGPHGKPRAAREDDRPRQPR
ncbi:MAG TPA: sugar transferase, partial [Pirellulales bacterium]|jgi:lipopolysaccharide/colanic/teichoic acid biosynthesis glycosyltransferase|nr:sugar transferase [Pirellulales bacterium]